MLLLGLTAIVELRAAGQHWRGVIKGPSSAARGSGAMTTMSERKERNMRKRKKERQERLAGTPRLPRRSPELSGAPERPGEERWLGETEMRKKGRG